MTAPILPLLPEPVPGRVCWSCPWIHYDNATGGGLADEDPGEDFRLACYLGYWEFDAFDDTLAQFRDKLRSAERCADFRFAE